MLRRTCTEAKNLRLKEDGWLREREGEREKGRERGKERERGREREGEGDSIVCE